VKFFPTSFFLAVLSLLICLIGFNYLFITSLGIAFSVYILLEFTDKLGKVVPIKEFITLIASFQWIVGAKIGYNIGKVHYKYYMYVDEDTYMTYIVPGVIFFYLGLKLIRSNLSIIAVKRFMQKNRTAAKRLAYFLLTIGLLSFMISKIVRLPAVAFIFYLTNLLIYVAVIHFMILFPNKKWQLFIISIGFFFLFSLGSGLFHDLIITAAFLLFFLFSERTKMRLKIGVLLFGLFSLYTLQLVKGDYREIIWESNKNANPIEAFFSVLEAEFAPANPVVNTVQLNKNAELEEQTTINTRLNQGWIISKIMDNVPHNQEYLQGKTIMESIEAAVLPRFLFPNKKGANDALINFRKITGIDITRGTSMGLSVIGEFYANYGQVGGWLAMLIYGLFLAIFIKMLQNIIAGGSPLILLWLIFFFFQVVKAETDFIKIFNHLIKSFLFFIFIQFGSSLLGMDLLLNKRMQYE